MRKRLLPALLTLALLLSLAPAALAAGALSYTDVDTRDLSYPAVTYLSANGYMTRYSAAQFAPNDTLSRAMFVTILCKVSGEPADAAGTQFADVPQDAWYAKTVTWAVENGITSGTGATTFSPDDPVTREQMAALLKKYADTKGGSSSVQGPV